MSILNPYLILDVKATASAGEIKAAYKRLAFKHHPDRNKGSQYHTERFREVVEAYDILTDPDKRARYDRHHRYESYIPPQRASTPANTKGNTHFGGSPYGRNTGFDPLRNVGDNQPRAGTFTGRGGKRYTYASPHQIFIALVLFACAAMGSLWFGTLMEHQTARERLAEGDYIAALEHDSTYGDAWFVLAENQAKRGYYAQAYQNVQRAFRLTEDRPPYWYWTRGRLAEQLGALTNAKEDYKRYLRLYPIAQSLDTAAFQDSATFRLAQIFVQYNHDPDSAYSILLGVSKTAQGLENFLYLRGLSAYGSGRYSESIRDLQAVADKGYRSADAYYTLGLAYLATADTATACTAWDIALTSGSLQADSLLRKWCTFGAHTIPSQPLTIYVKP